MGIDARILVKIHGEKNHLTPEQVWGKAAMFASTVGAQHFFLEVAGERGPQRHAITLCGAVTPEDVENGEFPANMLGRQVWVQDGPDIFAAPDEQFLSVDLMGRYYGPGYERGNWPVLYMIIRWLRQNIPHATVWYGGDSSGVCAELMDNPALEVFTAHFLRNGHRPYHEVFGRFDPPQTCPWCKIQMYPFRWAGATTTYTCSGCDKSFDLTPGGRGLKEVPKGRKL